MNKEFVVEVDAIIKKYNKELWGGSIHTFPSASLSEAITSFYKNQKEPADLTAILDKYKTTESEWTDLNAIASVIEGNLNNFQNTSLILRRTYRQIENIEQTVRRGKHFVDKYKKIVTVELSGDLVSVSLPNKRRDKILFALNEEFKELSTCMKPIIYYNMAAMLCYKAF